MSCAHTRLGRALVARAGGGTVLIDGESLPWASATFTGMRHRLAFLLPDAWQAGRFADGIQNHDFAIPGHLVADIAPDTMIATAIGVVVTIAALTIEEA